VTTKTTRESPVPDNQGPARSTGILLDDDAIRADELLDMLRLVVEVRQAWDEANGYASSGPTSFQNRGPNAEGLHHQPDAGVPSPFCVPTLSTSQGSINRVDENEG
jgi:hypothetical protein